MQKLIDLIMEETLSPGEKLPPERKMMELFGVGRSTLREAIGALSALNLVEVKVPDGTFVTDNFGDFYTKHISLMSKISFNNIIELIEARIILETDLVELATEKSNLEDHKKLDNIIYLMKNAKNNDEFLYLDLKFHTTIASIADNSFLFEIMNILREVTKEWIHKVIQIYSPKKMVIQQHDNIVKAIKDKNKKEAREQMNIHLNEVSNLLLETQNTQNENI